MFRIFLFSCLLAITFSACTSYRNEQYDLLITDVSVVDVRSGKVTPNQLIAISGDSIRLVQAAGNHNQPKARQVLNAKGKFAMPGMWDNHVHFRGGDTLIQENKNLLPLFLAFGITTVRDAGGDMTPSVFAWQEQIRKVTLAGPSIFSSGPKLDGTKPAWPGSIQVTNAASIEVALDSLQQLGVDYVKMYDGNLTADAFYGIIQAAEKRGMKTTGHMPLSANILTAISYGLDGTEHLYYVLKACSPLADSLTKLNLGYGMMDQIIDSYDPVLARHVFETLAKNKVAVTPTLHIGKTLAGVLDTEHQQDSMLAYIGPSIQQTYQGRIESARRAKARGNAMRQKMETKTQEMMVPMYNAGINLLAGSDCGAFNSFVYPGESLHGELESLTQAGLTPQQALMTSVVHGPRFLEVEHLYGSLEKGKVADILLLDANPLTAIENARSLHAVIKNGKVYTKAALAKMLQALKR